MIGMLSKRRFRGLIYFIVIVISLGYGYYRNNKQETPYTKGTVTIGYLNWQEDVAVTYLWQEILQEKGYKVELKNLDVAPLYVGLSRGDIDLFLDSWLPITQKAYWDNYKNQLDNYGSWYLGEAKIGLVVPKYADVNAIAGLNQFQDKFNGEIIGIDPGAGIMKAAVRAAKDYGLNYKIIQGSEAAMVASLDKAYRAKKWIVVTGWSPHWIFAKYELKYLSDEKKSFGEAEGLYVLANKKFTVDRPEVARMLKKFKLNDNQIGELEDMLQKGIDPQAAAREWVNGHRKLVDSWTQ